MYMLHGTRDRYEREGEKETSEDRSTTNYVQTEQSMKPTWTAWFVLTFCDWVVHWAHTGEPLAIVFFFAPA
jgi:hypothetical protein